MKKVLCFVLAILLMCSVGLSASAVSYSGNPEGFPDAEKHIASLVLSKYAPNADLGFSCYFKQVYSYPSVESSEDEADAEFIMFNFTVGVPEPMSGAQYIGEYVVYHSNYNSPSTLGYYVYVPEKDEVYTLKDAYNADIEGIEKAIAEGCSLSALKGDVNVDGILNIKDVTFIQKQLADLISSNPVDIMDKLGNGGSYFYSYVKDYNQDREINVKDATAIQKTLAGITE